MQERQKLKFIKVKEYKNPKTGLRTFSCSLDDTIYSEEKIKYLNEEEFFHFDIQELKAPNSKGYKWEVLLNTYIPKNKRYL